MLLQDFTGVPCVVDLAAMRDAMRDLGGDPKRINPLIPVELVIDHSVQVDEFASRLAIARNAELEFERNRERYAFLRWGQSAFDNFKVVPPNTGICHQVNLEYLARVVESRDGVAFPDTLVGTDSHTTMVNGLGVLGWGVGGIEAEAAMLGEALSMLVPQVVGFRLTGELPEGATATDLVLTVTEILRRTASSASSSSTSATASPRSTLADRATLGNMSPGVRRDVRLLPRRRRDARVPAPHGPPRRARSRSSRRTARRTCSGTTPTRSRRTRRSSSSTSATVEPSLAGPRRPQDRVPLARAKDAFVEALDAFGVDYANGARRGGRRDVPRERPDTEQQPGGEPEPSAGRRSRAVATPTRTRGDARRRGVRARARLAS